MERTVFGVLLSEDEREKDLDLHSSETEIVEWREGLVDLAILIWPPNLKDAGDGIRDWAKVLGVYVFVMLVRCFDRWRSL